jgi:hypothetical protein
MVLEKSSMALSIVIHTSKIINDKSMIYNLGNRSSQTWSPAKETGNILPPLLLLIVCGRNAAISAVSISQVFVVK